MIILDSSNKLQIILGAAVATNQSTGVVSYVELDASGTPTPSIATFTTNGNTAVDIVAAPASGKQRLIKGIHFQNADTASIAVTIRTNASGTLSTCVLTTLQPLDNFVYEDGGGFYLLDSNGQYRSTATVPYRLIRTPQYLTSGTSYTVPSGCNAIEIEMVGGGGGGGGASQSAANASVGAGGGAAAYVRKFIANPQTTAITYAIGGTGTAGGSGAGTGGTGGSTTFTCNGTTYTAAGGAGGVGMAFGTTALNALGGAGGAGTNGDVNMTGAPGLFSIRQSGTIAVSGSGASSPFGNGGNGLITEAAGNDGAGYGSGGGGGCCLGTTARAGGVGQGGLIIVREYY